jgi:hypothetical protein
LNEEEINLVGSSINCFFNSIEWLIKKQNAAPHYYIVLKFLVVPYLKHYGTLELFDMDNVEHFNQFRKKMIVHTNNGGGMSCERNYKVYNSEEVL